MSFVNTWLDKESVMRDLAKVSGSKVARAGRNDEGYLVIGDGPPPVALESEDDEMLQQFGDVIRERCTSQYECVQPDLEGITNLIRLVQMAENADDNEDTNIAEPSDCVIAISKVSNLNPNVKEFIPNCNKSSPSSSDVSDVQPQGVDKTDKINIVVETKGNKSCNDNVDVKNTNPIIINEDLATKLKNEISDASKSDTFETKKQKNVAISTLLRLYANTNNNVSKIEPPKTKQPVKLITPEYFENKNVPNKPAETTSTESSSTTPVPKSISSSSPSAPSIDIKSELECITQGTKGTCVKPTVDPIMKKSIDKVTEWMNEPAEKRKSPAVFLGPIAFKRKEPTASKSPTNCNTEHKVSKPISGNQYKPSNYAFDLGKKYMERNKKKEQKVNMWTNLDVILKERDEILAKKQVEKSSENNSVSE